MPIAGWMSSAASPAIAQVVSTETVFDVITVTVTLNGGPATATATKQCAADVVPGAYVVMLPIGQGWGIIGTFPQSAGGLTPGPNLIPDNGFEAAVDGKSPAWDDAPNSTGAYSSSADTSMARTGTTSMRVDCSADGLVAVSHWLRTTSAIRLDPETMYRFQAWTQATSTTMTAGVVIVTGATDAEAELTSPTANVIAPAPNDAPSPSWGLAAFGAFSPPAGHTFARVLLRTTAPAGLGCTARYDDTCLQAIS